MGKEIKFEYLIRMISDYSPFSVKKREFRCKNGGCGKKIKFKKKDKEVKCNNCNAKYTISKRKNKFMIYPRKGKSKFEFLKNKGILVTIVFGILAIVIAIFSQMQSEDHYEESEMFYNQSTDREIEILEEIDNLRVQLREGNNETFERKLKEELNITFLQAKLLAENILKYSQDAYEKGLSYSTLGNYTIAIKYYEEAIVLNPKNVNAWFHKGNALYQLGKYSEAIQCYNEAIKLNPNHSEAHNNLGVSLVELKRYEEAE